MLKQKQVQKINLHQNVLMVGFLVKFQYVRSAVVEN